MTYRQPITQGFEEVLGCDFQEIALWVRKHEGSIRHALLLLDAEIRASKQDDDFPDAVMRVGYQAQADALAPKLPAPQPEPEKP